MKNLCPNCQSEDGMREAINGLPEFPVDESKFFIAGCTGTGSSFVCIGCGWGIDEERA